MPKLREDEKYSMWNNMSLNNKKEIDSETYEQALNKAKENYENALKFKTSQNTTNALEKMKEYELKKPQNWNGGNYSGALAKAVDKLTSRKPFTYDLNGDALYQQYKDQYVNQGKQAMMDAIGQASAMTGGYGNSYAQTVGQQTYQGYLQGLNDKIPDLYGAALDKYNAEGNQLVNNVSALGSMRDQEYGEWQDQNSLWQREIGRLTDDYNDSYNKDVSEYKSNLGVAEDNYNDAIARYQKYISAGGNPNDPYKDGALDNESTVAQNNYNAREDHLDMENLVGYLNQYLTEYYGTTKVDEKSKVATLTEALKDAYMNGLISAELYNAMQQMITK